jgi:hypothetical protein
VTNDIEVERGRPADLPKLFTVTCIANVNGYRDVPVDLFVDRNLNDEEMWCGIWTALIAESPETPGYGYTQAAIAELFTEGEAKELIEYLERISPRCMPTMTPRWRDDVDDDIPF